jgi:two-component system cell cycle sensor histidine kinase/response regulator CckA
MRERDILSGQKLRKERKREDKICLAPGRGLMADLALAGLVPATHNPMTKTLINSPLRLTLVYALVGGLWIVSTDAWVIATEGGGLSNWFHAAAKGLLFIGVTSVLLYLLVKRLLQHEAATNRRLRESQQRWQFALEGAGDGLWDWNGETKEVFYSPRWKAMLGYAENEVGHRLEDWEKLVHPEDRARAQTEFGRHFRGETAAYACEQRMLTKDGGYKWVLVRGQVVRRDAAGRPLRAIGTQTDISERKAADLRIQDALAFNDVLFNSAAAGVIAYRSDGQAIIANRTAAELVGTTVEKLVEQNFRRIESWQKSGLRAAAEQALAENREVGLATEITTTFGRHLWLDARMVPFQYQGQRHLSMIFVDRSHQKQLEAQVVRAQRLESLGLLASGIAHDLNNMLAPILLSVGLLKQRHGGERATLDQLDMIENAAQRGAGVVRQVLTFARGVDGERVEIHPKHLIHEVVRLIEETFPRDIAIENEIDPAVSTLVGDMTQLHQVLLNLAVNARDAMPNGGRLVLGARNVSVGSHVRRHAAELRPGEYVALTVADTGTGIAPEVLEHIFEPFFTTKPRGKGTGLGLSTVYGIVRSHGGSVEITSAPGAGSEFIVLLPAAPVAAGPADARQSTPPLLHGVGRTVLVVDDEEPIRRLTALILTRHGFVPEEAQDGLDGLEKFRAQPDRYAAVVLDLMMPGLSGYELAQEIRLLAPKLPIMASSGLSDDTPDRENEQTLRGLGVRTLLRKPYTEREFLRAFEQVLAGADRPAPHAKE